MQTIRSFNLQKNLGEVLQAADVEPVVLLNREQPRTVLVSADEFIRLKVAAGEPVPKEVRKSRPILHRTPEDPLGYDTRDPAYALAMAADALSGINSDAVQQEMNAALRRWGMRG